MTMPDWCVRRIGEQNLVPRLAFMLEVSFANDAAELGPGRRGRLQADLVHAGDFRQHAGKMYINQCALRGARRLERMTRPTGMGDGFFINLGCTHVTLPKG